MIGKLRTPVTVLQYAYTQDQGGGIAKSVQRQFVVYAHVSQGNYLSAGGQVTDNSAQQWSTDYKVKIRYDASQAVKVSDQIVYNGKTLTISRIQPNEENKISYLTLYCSTING